MGFLCSFLRAHFKGVTTDGVVKCYLKEVDNCATPSILDLKPFLEHPGLMAMAKNYTLTNSAPIFAMKTMIIFMGVYPKTHTLPLTALTYSSFLIFFLSKPSKGYYMQKLH